MADLDVGEVGYPTDCSETTCNQQQTDMESGTDTSNSKKRKRDCATDTDDLQTTQIENNENQLIQEREKELQELRKAMETLKNDKNQRIQEREKELQALRKAAETLKTQLGENQRRFHQRIQEREKKLQELRKALESLKSSAQTAVEDSEMSFTEMIRFIERRRSEVSEMIRSQKKSEVNRAERLLKRLEQEIAELKRRDAELEQLSNRDDHILFLKTFQSVSELPESKDSATNVIQSVSFEAVGKAVLKLKEQLENLIMREYTQISGVVSEVQTVVPSEPSTREEFLQYACNLTLDPNTVHKTLALCRGNRKVKWVNKHKQYPKHPERFSYWPQVLCREGLSGRCYWEAEWIGYYGAEIAVTYKSIKRKGGNNNILIGREAKSWSMFCSPRGYSACDDKKCFEMSAPSSGSRRVGVYLDRPAGTVSFYSVSSDTLTHLHTFHSRFTQPLYPAFCVWNDASVSLCQIT